MGGGLEVAAALVSPPASEKADPALALLGDEELERILAVERVGTVIGAEW
jgi:hypothetical protein